MSAGFPFPGAPGAMPGGVPGAPMQPAFGGQQPAAPVAFVLDIPADPTWEPMEMSDTLAMDGFYAAKIVGEKPREGNNGLQVIFTLELIDPDVAGKKISRFLPHPAQTKGDTWFLWRGLLRSIGGTTDHGRQAMRYTPGMFVGQYVYVKTEAYWDDKGVQRTGVADWRMRTEWEEACKTNRHRWAVRQPASPAGSVGALPTGLPGFPGMPGAPGGMPGGPQMPTAPAAGVPQPGTAPMQPPPQQPQVQTAPVLPGAPMAAPPPPAQPGFAPPQPPPGFAPPQPVQTTQPSFPAFPGQNGAVPQPPPTAAGIATSFPGMK